MEKETFGNKKREIFANEEFTCFGLYQNRSKELDRSADLNNKVRLKISDMGEIRTECDYISLYGNHCMNYTSLPSMERERRCPFTRLKTTDFGQGEQKSSDEC